jgi:hypothetical protein
VLQSTNCPLRALPSAGALLVLLAIHSFQHFLIFDLLLFILKGEVRLTHVCDADL